MANYLIDTNILLRLSDPISANYALARDSTYLLIDQGHKGCFTSQIIILGENYFRALALPVKTKLEQTFIFLTSWGSSSYIRINLGKVFVFPLEHAEAQYYGYGLVGLKGFLFKRFAEKVFR